MPRLFLLLLFTAWFAGGQAPPPTGVPVRLQNETLFLIQRPAGPITAEARAEEIGTRLEMLAERGYVEPVEVRDFGSGRSALFVGEVFVLSVSDGDAAAAGRERGELAVDWAAIVEKALKKGAKRFTWVSFLLASLQALAAWALFIVILWLIKRGFDWVTTWIQGKFNELTRKRNVRGLNLLLWERLFLFILLLIKVATGIFLLFQFSLLVSFTFGLFPATQGISLSLFEYFRATFGAIGTSVLDYLPRGGFVVILAMITFYGIRLMKLFFQAIERGDIDFAKITPETATPTYQLLRILVILFVLVVAFPYLPGGESDAFKGISIFIGVLLSLGSGSAMGNITSGVIITYMRPFRLGDRVRIGDTIGDVITKGLLVTRVRTPKNVEIVVPNATILSSQIVNYSSLAREKGLILHTTITIGYDVPWRQVHELLKEAALATPGILADPPPFVLQTALNDWHVSYELNAHTDDANRMPVTYSGLHENIQERFNAAGVEIMSPSFYALRDGNTVTIPENQRPADYKVPAFRVEKPVE
ncbi:MAG: mechanosensitive ion channel family protein [Bryobacteraceae bacterium]|nr:mechanosensitive ion channel family protein [Bryobacteraceae bacterium]